MHRTESDFVREQEVAKLLRDQDWRDGLIGDAAYTASLLGLGYRAKDAQVELMLLKLGAPTQGDKRMERSRAWLRQHLR